MRREPMNKMPSFLTGWSAFVLFVLFAVVPSSVVFLTLLPTITHDPLLATVCFFLYEVIIGIGTLFVSFGRKIWERRIDAWADVSAGKLEKFLYLLFTNTYRRYRTFFVY